MTYTGEKIDVAQEAGQLGIDLLNCDTPPVSYYVAEADDGKPVFEDDTRFWGAWTDIRNRVASFTDENIKVEEWREEDVPFISASGTRYVSGEEFAHAHADYSTDGVLVITLEFQIEEGWSTYISQRAHELSALDIGQQIGAIELAVLANELESPTETLDYWMTDVLYTFRQATWADVRQVSAQTVSDRVRAAEEKLGEE